eukprot:6489292-Amphidinium_carterae.1
MELSNASQISHVLRQESAGQRFRRERLGGGQAGRMLSPHDSNPGPSIQQQSSPSLPTRSMQ